MLISIVIPKISYAEIVEDKERIIALIDLTDSLEEGKPFYSTLDGEWFFFS